MKAHAPVPEPIVPLSEPGGIIKNHDFAGYLSALIAPPGAKSNSTLRPQDRLFSMD